MSEGITAHHGLIGFGGQNYVCFTYKDSPRLKISRKGQTTLINTVVSRNINHDTKNSENRQDPYNPNNYYCNEILKLH